METRGRFSWSRRDCQGGQERLWRGTGDQSTSSYPASAPVLSRQWGGQLAWTEGRASIRSYHAASLGVVDPARSGPAEGLLNDLIGPRRRGIAFMRRLVIVG
jgi:hypothetical protein